MGRTVVLDTGAAQIVITERNQEPWDRGIFESVGIDPRSKRFLLLKSRMYFRPVFLPIAKGMVLCDSIGVGSSDWTLFRYEKLRHPIYVDDFIEGVEAAALAPSQVSGGTFNLAGPRWMTVSEMVSDFAKAINVRPPTLHAPRWMGLTVGWAAEQVSAVVGGEPPISRRTLAFFENDNAFDISAARQAFGFDPRTELEGGVRQAASHGA